MRIVIVNQHPSVALGGSETQCALIADGLARRGHEVRYVAVGGARIVATEDGPEVVGVARSASEVIAACAGFRPDVVYWRIGRWQLRAAARAARRHGFLLVFASSSDDDLIRLPPARTTRTGPVGRRLERAIEVIRAARSFGSLGQADLIVVNNPDHLGRIPGVREVHIANGVDARAGVFVWPRPYVAWVANLKPVKRPEECIPLAEALRSSGVDVLMAGRIQVAGYERFEDPEQLPENLHYLGPLSQEQVNALLAGALVHVHTCGPEGFPNVFIQAWWHGTPSVSLGFDPGGLIRAEGLGAVCGDDPERFAAAVLAFLSDGAARRAAGDRARSFAHARFDPEVAVLRLEQELRALVGESA